MAMPIPESFASMPVNTGADPSAMQPASLGSLANLPQGNIPKPNHTRQTLGNIAGILGDALMAYGGMQPQFGPNLMRQQDQERQMGFEREKLNAMLEAKRQQALEPPQFAQNALWFQKQPKEVQQAILQSMDQTNPIFTATPQGTQVNHRYSGPPPEAVSELRAAISQGDQSAISEFEQVFGPGSARDYLGQ
jgi:hypothetical protein